MVAEVLWDKRIEMVKKGRDVYLRGSIGQRDPNGVVFETIVFEVTVPETWLSMMYSIPALYADLKKES